MEPTLAQVLLFAGNFEPSGWAYCDGRLMSIAQNSALFSLLGTMYGGDGVNTFALPDLRGRMAIGQGQGRGLSFHSLGEAAGHETTTLMSSQLPAHTHAVHIPVSDIGGTTDDPTGNINAVTGTAGYSAPPGSGSYGGVSVSTTGANQPIATMQPLLALNYIIATEGIYPSRN